MKTEICLFVPCFRIRRLAKRDAWEEGSPPDSLLQQQSIVKLTGKERKQLC